MRDAISLGNAQAFQRIGEAFDLGQQFAVGERAGIAGLALPEEGDLVAAPQA